MTTNRSQFEVSITTTTSDFGYDNKQAPSDAELMGRVGVDKRGSVRTVSEYIAAQKQQLGGTYHRVVIRECATGEFWTFARFSALDDERRALASL
ncbi:MAG: hypothetical protein ABFD89_17825 [Bryobacteraceae bacterium]